MSPGYRSDLALFGALGEVREVRLCGGSVGWRCALPRLADYPWANLLLLREAPREASIPELLRRFDALFPGPEVAHVSIGWDRSLAPTEELAPLLAQGFSSVDCVVMQRPAGAPWRSTRPPPEGLVLRAVDVVAVRGALLGCHLALDAEEPVRWGEDLLSRRLDLYADLLARPGAGRCYVAELDGVLVASLGVFNVDGWGRLQAVGTHPAHRRRGVGEALLRVACSELARGVRGVQLIAWRGGRAQSFYERLGFALSGSHVGVVRRRAPQ